ncbi:MAG: PaaI family thioesterase [Rhodobacteraceae bacterium]|nr:PaaI family thioesterase [Paracoccaceae bacterium]
MTSAPPEAAAQSGDGLIVGQSGAQALVGYIVDVGQPDRLGRAYLDIDARHINRNGKLHGGIQAMLLDAACGFTASLHLGQGVALTPLVTVSLTLQYVGAADLGQRVTAIGHLVGGGRKIAHIHGELTDDSGRMIATALGVFKKVPGERFT